MRALWHLAVTEVRRFRGPLPMAAAIFLVCVPLLYGAMYLWSNWNPYGRLADLTVAVVNLDRPVTIEGQAVNGGTDIVDQLTADTSSFTWRTTDAADAASGIADGRYAFSLTIPSDFSSDLTSITQGTPKRAQVAIAFDNSQGYMLGVMAETAESELRSQLNAAAVKAYAESALGSLAQLQGGLAKTESAAQKLSDGAGKVADGVATMDKKVTPVVHKVTTVLKDSSKEAVTVSAAVAADTADIAQLASEINRGQQDIDAAMNALLKAHPELADDKDVQAIRADIDRVSEVTARTQSTAKRVADDASSVHRFAVAVNGHVGDIVQAAETAVVEVDALRDGAADVAAGNTELAAGIHRISQALPSPSAGERVRDADAVSNPVELRTEIHNDAVYYGRGLAPFFFGVALWVFGLVAFVLMRPVSKQALASRTNAVVIAMGAFVPPAILGCLGALVLLGVTDAGLGLKPDDLVGTAGLSMLAVMAFTALAQALRGWFGLPGSAVMLILLIVQLSGAGGLYPIEVMPAFFQAVHPWLPMTYVVNSLRVSISGGSASQYWTGVAVLVGVLAVGLVASIALAARSRVWTRWRLHPPLEG